MTVWNAESFEICTLRLLKRLDCATALPHMTLSTTPLHLQRQLRRRCLVTATHNFLPIPYRP